MIFSLHFGTLKREYVLCDHDLHRISAAAGSKLVIADAILYFGMCPSQALKGDDPGHIEHLPSGSGYRHLSIFSLHPGTHMRVQVLSTLYFVEFLEQGGAN